MKNCYLCDEILNNNNRSKEHILLNAIGGRLKSDELLCNSCNSELGHKSDSELANQLLFISSFLQVKRDSGDFPILKGLTTSDGTEYHLMDGSRPILSKPTVEIKKEENQITFSVSARNEKELLKILKGIQSKYPGVDIGKAKESFEHKEEYLDDYLKHRITIGGELAFQSIVKTAVNYYILKQNEKSQVVHLFDYLQDKATLKIINHFNPKNRPYQREPGEVIHLIYLFGNSYSKLLYCYIELFSSFSFLVILNENYSGENFSHTYCYDVLKNTEIQKNVSLKLNKARVNEIINTRGINFKNITLELNRVMEIGHKRQVDEAISAISNKAIEKIFAQKYGHEQRITEQMVDELSQEISLNFVKFLYRGKKQPELTE